MMFDDLPQDARNALLEANHDHVVERLNEALHVVAICQQRLRLRSVISTLQAGGEVVISTLADAAGQNSPIYARVDRVSRQIAIRGNRPAQPADVIDDITNPGASAAGTESAD
jgi:hypothetical protein